MRLIALASLAALAACTSAETPEEQPADTNNLLIETPAPNVDEAAATNDVAANSHNAAAVPEMADFIPAALRGRWGLVPADCTSTRGDNKGLVEITAGRLRFYESRATIAKINEQDESRLDADFAFEGEGQSWTLRMTMDAQDGNTVLIRRDYGADAMPGPLRYERCAA